MPVYLHATLYLVLLAMIINYDFHIVKAKVNRFLFSHDSAYEDTKTP